MTVRAVAAPPTQKEIHQARVVLRFCAVHMPESEKACNEADAALHTMLSVARAYGAPDE